MGPDADADLRAYYARRAPEYDRLYERPERQAELRALEASLPALLAGCHVLEVACGTGWWTRCAARDAASWLATDISPEMLAIARAKTMPACVQFARADANTLRGLGAMPFDAAFAGCWWSHVPLQRLPAWLATLHGRLQPGARIVMLDNCFVPGSSTPLSRRDAAGNSYQQRRLDDGSVHEVLKNFPTRAAALAALGTMARDPEWVAHRHHWTLSYHLP